MKLKKFISILLVLMFLVIACTGCSLTKDEKEDEEDKKESYSKVVDNYFKGMEKADAEMYLKAYPDFIYSDEDIDDDDMEDMLEMFEDEYGENIKISYEITDETEIEKEDLENVEKYVLERYDEEVKISGGYEVEVEATIKGDDDEDTDTNDMYIYKVDGEWVYLNVSPETAESYLE